MLSEWDRVPLIAVKITWCWPGTIEVSAVKVRFELAVSVRLEHASKWTIQSGLVGGEKDNFVPEGEVANRYTIPSK